MLLLSQNVLVIIRFLAKIVSWLSNSNRISYCYKIDLVFLSQKQQQYQFQFSLKHPYEYWFSGYHLQFVSATCNLNPFLINIIFRCQKQNKSSFFQIGLRKQTGCISFNTINFVFFPNALIWSPYQYQVEDLFILQKLSTICFTKKVINSCKSGTVRIICLFSVEEKSLLVNTFFSTKR